MSLKDIFSLQTIDGEPVSIQGYEVTPQSQSITVRLPFVGFVWNRPLAVKVVADGGEERIPIVDATRVAQVAIYGIATILGLAMWRVSGRNKQ